MKRCFLVVFMGSVMMCAACLGLPHRVTPPKFADDCTLTLFVREGSKSVCRYEKRPQPVLLKELESFLGEHPTGWHGNWHTPPTGECRVVVWKGDTIVQTIEIGNGWIGLNDSEYKDIPIVELDRLKDLLKLDK